MRAAPVPAPGRATHTIVDLLLFYLFGAVAVAASLLVIGQRNPMYSVLLLIASFGALAGLYVLLEAPFVAVVQIIIYAGAIMVIFLFVVMLLNVGGEDRAVTGALAGPRRFGAVLAAALAVELFWALGSERGVSVAIAGAVPFDGSVRAIGQTLFTRYAFAFEVTAILTLVAMVAAVVLTRRLPRATRVAEPDSTPESHGADA